MHNKLFFLTWTHTTYSCGELILQPLQVEVKIRLWHLFRAPASQLGEDSRSHVDDEAIGAVQEGQEWSPDIFLALWSVVYEDFNASSILLKYFQVANQPRDDDRNYASNLQSKGRQSWREDTGWLCPLRHESEDSSKSWLPGTLDPSSNEPSCRCPRRWCTDSLRWKSFATDCTTASWSSAFWCH